MAPKMARKIGLVVGVLIHCLVVLAHSKDMTVEHYETDFVSNKLFQALVARVDQLEKKLEARDHVHQKEMGKLRHNHEEQLKALRQEHQTEIATLRHRNDENMDMAGQLAIRQHEAMQQLTSTVQQQSIRIDKLEKLLEDNTNCGNHEALKEILASVNGVGCKNVGKTPKQRVLKGKPGPVRGEISAKQRRVVRRFDNELNVAFFATLSADLTHIGTNQAIAFDHVVTNLGNNYHPHVGTFIAPVTGTYVFSVTLRTSGTHTTVYALYRNLNLITRIFVNGADNNYDTTSNTAILRLSKDDDVMVKHISSDHTLRGDHFTMFSGFLLFQDFSDSSSVVVGK